MGAGGSYSRLRKGRASLCSFFLVALVEWVILCAFCWRFAYLPRRWFCAFDEGINAIVAVLLLAYDAVLTRA